MDVEVVSMMVLMVGWRWECGWLVRDMLMAVWLVGERRTEEVCGWQDIRFRLLWIEFNRQTIYRARSRLHVDWWP